MVLRPSSRPTRSVLRDVDGAEITEAEGRTICTQRYKVPAESEPPAAGRDRPRAEEAGGFGQ